MASTVCSLRTVFRGALLVDRYMAGQCGSDAEAQRALEVIGQWHERLSDISWYMRCLNEHIAREANREDGCKGRFWEGRFKSQALLDERALLACMAYVDLNPIRVGLVDTPEGSDFTSIQERIRDYMAAREGDLHRERPPALSPASDVAVYGDKEDGEPVESRAALAAFTGSRGDAADKGLPFHFSDYLELVDWSGRAIREDKRGSIPANVPPILERLGLDGKSWMELVRHFRRHFFDYVGPADVLAQYSRTRGRSWVRGVRACRTLLGGGDSGFRALSLQT